MAKGGSGGGLVGAGIANGAPAGSSATGGAAGARLGSAAPASVVNSQTMATS